jgi:branched-chain amino acid transport system permease protein
MLNIVVIINGLILGSLYSLIAAGFSLIYGIEKRVYLAYGAFYVLGAYLMYLLFNQIGLNLFAAILIAVTSMFFLGIVLEKTLVRKVKKYADDVMLITLGFAIFAENVVIAIWGPWYLFPQAYVSGDIRISGDISVPTYQIVIFFIAITIFLLLKLVIGKTMFGKAIQATSQNETGALLMGINVNWISSMVTGLGSALAACGGIFLAPIYAINPYGGWSPLIRALGIVVVGGMGSLEGSFVAGITLGLVESLIAYYVSPTLRVMAYFIAIILILFLRPKGFFGKGA